MRRLDLPRETDSIVDAGEMYIAIEWSVFPLFGITPNGCACGKADCGSPGKHPILSGGHHNAVANVDEWRALVRRFPGANLGLPVPAGHVVLDVDGGEGVDSRLQLELEHGRLPPTTGQQSGSRGEHWLMTDENPDELRQDVKFLPGLDTRCAGRGYIVAAPSLHISGRRYRWLETAEPQPLPAWLRAMIAKPKAAPRKPYVRPTDPAALPAHMAKRERYCRAVLRGVCADIAATPKGSKGQSGRNDALNKGWWKVQQYLEPITLDEARAALTEAALACGLDEREIAKVLR